MKHLLTLSTSIFLTVFLGASLGYGATATEEPQATQTTVGHQLPPAADMSLEGLLAPVTAARTLRELEAAGTIAFNAINASLVATANLGVADVFEGARTSMLALRDTVVASVRNLTGLGLDPSVDASASRAQRGFFSDRSDTYGALNAQLAALVTTALSPDEAQLVGFLAGLAKERSDAYASVFDYLDKQLVTAQDRTDGTFTAKARPGLFGYASGWFFVTTRRWTSIFVPPHEELSDVQPVVAVLNSIWGALGETPPSFVYDGPMRASFKGLSYALPFSTAKELVSTTDPAAFKEAVLALRGILGTELALYEPGEASPRLRTVTVNPAYVPSVTAADFAGAAAATHSERTRGTEASDKPSQEEDPAKTLTPAANVQTTSGLEDAAPEAVPSTTTATVAPSDYVAVTIPPADKEKAPPPAASTPKTVPATLPTLPLSPPSARSTPPVTWVTSLPPPLSAPAATAGKGSQGLACALPTTPLPTYRSAVAAPQDTTSQKLKKTKH